MSEGQETRIHFQRFVETGVKHAFRLRSGQHFLGWVVEVCDDAILVEWAPCPFYAQATGTGEMASPNEWVRLGDIDPSSISFWDDETRRWINSATVVPSGERDELGKRIVSQPTDPVRPKPNRFRRGIGIFICFGPAVLVFVSLAKWGVDRGGGYYGLSPAVIGLLIGLFNAYLSFARPWLYRRKHGSMAGFQFTSGTPALGTLIVVYAALLGFGEGPTAFVGLLALALDTGGLPWFLIQTWPDTGFWDGEPSGSAI